jgi:acyl carrier protein
LSEFRDLKFIPDWPRTRQLVAKHLGCSEDEVQSMKESGDSLDQVQLALGIEEVLGIPIDQYPQS